MKPAPFSYHRPASLDEAVRSLATHGAVGKIIAGGQSLVPSMNFRLARPDVLIDINNIPEIQGVRVEDDTIVIGSVTRHATFHKPVCDDPVGRMLSKVVQNIAHYPIRQRGTFGGSLCHADPASEWCLVAITLGAEIEIAGQDGTRRVAASEFFRGTFMTAVGETELLARLRLPRLPHGWGSGFYEFSRRKGDFALAMALAMLRLDGDRIIDARLGLGAVSAHSVRLDALEAQLKGQCATDETFSAVAAAAQKMVSPSSDIHGSAEYRRDLTGTVIRRALAAARADCRTGGAA
ncbi:FAD binding domain-containing protein [Defluviimonas sp. SAOS-178_SWC]|uniref:FAD binding domain-containing protein n=1 Tax=Defluviimonas sp. SAOS-178_SWC TaxID=3121287 RepID=UPI003221854E